jgi:hypothetical protein
VASADVMAITKWLISDSEECPDWVWDAGPAIKVVRMHIL